MLITTQVCEEYNFLKRKNFKVCTYNQKIFWTKKLVNNN